VWPPFRPNDRVRVRRSGRFGDVNAIEPNERGDHWLFEIVFERADDAAHEGAELVFERAEVAHYETDELELVEASGQEHDPEIELALDVPDGDDAVVADRVLRLLAETFAVERAKKVDAGHLCIGISPRAHPRDAVHALMARLGSTWFVEDDGWYANVTWARESFPIAGVRDATIFLRPYRDPHPGERLPGEPVEGELNG
jgi:hypothetical protein